MRRSGSDSFQHRRLHDHSIDAVTALRRLFRNEGFLTGMRFLRRAQILEDNNSLTRCRRDRGNSGTDSLSVELYGAGSALRQPTAKPRAL